jgi:NAD(P)H-nitrite reductase large subunit
VVGEDGPSSRIVCACRLVSEEAIITAIHAGTGSLLELIRRSDAGTRCGACLPTLWKLLDGERTRSEQSDGDRG